MTTTTTGPTDIDPRAAAMAISLVEGHHEAATGSHMHWLYREVARHMHRDFTLAAREQALAAREQALAQPSNSARKRSRGRQKNTNSSAPGETHLPSESDA